LDEEFTLVIYKVCTNIKMICTHNISQLKEILNFQKYRLLTKCLEKSWKLNTLGDSDHCHNFILLELGQ
jgi:hypothetical protein